MFLVTLFSTPDNSELSEVIMEVVLEHYKQIDIIRQAERQVETNFKIKPYDISHWNSGEEYKKLLLSALELPPLSNLSDYCYSYSYSNKVKTKILSQHSFINAACTIFNSATAAIATICCALKEQGMRKVCIINPSYFSVSECFKTFNFDVTCINLEYEETYRIPFKKIKEVDADVVWITQPVFSTGTYLSNSELQELAKKASYLVCDASMCDTINHLSDLRIDCKKAIFLFSPHKVISLNGVKFSYALCSTDMKNALEDWGDIIGGSITSSSALAVDHYLSDNYSKCRELHTSYVERSHTTIDQIIKDNQEIIKKCGESEGTYETLSILKVPFIEQVNLDFMYNLMSNTFVSITPGCANGFDKQNGFCFRVNHTLNINENTLALMHLISYFRGL